jgi:GT2 family glycosyltransferase
MYAWQEDADFSSRASAHGHMVLYPPCRGVHMGSSSGRTSGVRFGYSQIANPIFLVKKGTMSWPRARNLMIRNIVSNVAKTLTMNRIKDFPGRLRGNLRAGLHLLSGKLHPEQIVHM